MSEQTRPYCLGALLNINIPDNFDDIEINADELFGIK